jgi:hypothetical protein
VRLGLARTLPGKTTIDQFAVLLAGLLFVFGFVKEI